MTATTQHAPLVAAVAKAGGIGRLKAVLEALDLIELSGRLETLAQGLPPGARFCLGCAAVIPAPQGEKGCPRRFCPDCKRTRVAKRSQDWRKANPDKKKAQQDRYRERRNARLAAKRAAWTPEERERERLRRQAAYVKRVAKSPEIRQREALRRKAKRAAEILGRPAAEIFAEWTAESKPTKP